MFNQMYNNFVRPSSSEDNNSSATNITGRTPLSGAEAREIYLNEIKQIKDLDKRISSDKPSLCRSEQTHKPFEISDKDLFLSVQNDDIDTLKRALDSCPDKVNKLDDYGWSLLMIACQANSIDCVKELLIQGADTSVRDKAGNSAQSLIIKNKNLLLADLILSSKSKQEEIKTKIKKRHDKSDKPYFCELCNIEVKSKEVHLSSTIHNINLSKDKKLPTNYVIPESNRGYQIMLKVGWDKDSGLGPDGSGKKYPIKAVQKPDRKGLGHGKRVLKADKETENAVKCKSRKMRDHESNRKMEINFRRQFY